MITIQDFCAHHGACADGRKWALETGCATMREIWDREDLDPEYRLWIATRQGVMSNKDLRLFSCWCVRQIWHLLTDIRSRNAVEVSERYDTGDATDEELTSAWEAAGEAGEAAREAAGEAARAAAREAAGAAARAAAWEAARAAARAAAWEAGAAAWAAAGAAAWEAARAAARAAQVNQLKTYQINLAVLPKDTP